MRKTEFSHYLKLFGLAHAEIYEDISEIGTVVWNNEQLSIQIFCAAECEPRLLLVALASTGGYCYYESELKQGDYSSLNNIIKYAQSHSELLHQLAVSGRATFNVEVSEKRWGFTTKRPPS